MEAADLIDLIGALGTWAAVFVAFWVARLLQPRERHEERVEAERRAVQEKAEDEVRERIRLEGIARMMVREVGRNGYAIAALQGSMGGLLDRKGGFPLPDEWNVRTAGIRLSSQAYDMHFGELADMQAALSPAFRLDELQNHHYAVDQALELWSAVETALEAYHADRDSRVFGAWTPQQDLQHVRTRLDDRLLAATISGEAFESAWEQAYG